MKMNNRNVGFAPWHYRRNAGTHTDWKTQRIKIKSYLLGFLPPHKFNYYRGGKEYLLRGGYPVIQRLEMRLKIMRTKIKMGTDLELDALARKFLSIYDTDNELERKEKEFQYEAIIEVNIEVAVKMKVDIISVVEDEINEYWWENKADAEQFLSPGRVVEVGQNILYSKLSV
jgi:hypothetical protein